MSREIPWDAASMSLGVEASAALDERDLVARDGAEAVPDGLGQDDLTLEERIIVQAVSFLYFSVSALLSG